MPSGCLAELTPVCDYLPRLAANRYTEKDNVTPFADRDATRWIYRTEFVELDSVGHLYGGEPLLQKKLNELGAEGWKLVTSFVQPDGFSTKLACILMRERN